MRFSEGTATVGNAPRIPIFAMQRPGPDGSHQSFRRPVERYGRNHLKQSGGKNP